MHSKRRSGLDVANMKVEMHSKRSSGSDVANMKNVLIDVRKILISNDMEQYNLFLQLLKQHSDIKYFSCYRPFYYLKEFKVHEAEQYLNSYIIDQWHERFYYVDIDGNVSLFNDLSPWMLHNAMCRVKRLLISNNILPSSTTPPTPLMEQLNDSDHVEIINSITNLLGYLPGHKIIPNGITYEVQLKDQWFKVALSHQVVQEATKPGVLPYLSYTAYEPHSLPGKSQADAFCSIRSFNLINDMLRVSELEKIRRLKIQSNPLQKQFVELENQFLLLHERQLLTYLELSRPLLSNPEQLDRSLLLQSMAELPGTDLRKLIDLAMPLKLKIAREIVTVFARLHGERLVHCDVTPANILVNLIDGKIQDLFLIDTDDIKPFFKVDPANRIPYTPGYYLDYERRKYVGEREEQYAVAIVLLEFLTGRPIEELTTDEGELTQTGLLALATVPDEEMRGTLLLYTYRGPSAFIDKIVTSSEEKTQEEIHRVNVGAQVQQDKPPQISPKKRTNAEIAKSDVSDEQNSSSFFQPGSRKNNKQMKKRKKMPQERKRILPQVLFPDLGKKSP